MNTSIRIKLLRNLSKSAIFALAITATAGQAWADKLQPTAATLTLLSEINEVLAGIEDSEGLSQETLVQLAESVLWTSEPYVDLASSEPALLSSYSGAKLTNNNGEIAYIAINTSAVETVVSFPDTYSMNVPADGFAIRLQNFGHNYYILDFGGKIVVDGRDFLIATPGAAVELPYVGDGRSYTFTDSGMSLDSGAITVNGAMEVFGTDGDDDFDFRGLKTPLDYAIYLDAKEGIDTLRISNFDSIIYLDADSNTFSKESLGFHINNFENIIGGEGANTLVGSNIDTTWTVSSPNSGSINSGSEISFQNIGNLQSGNNTDTFLFLDGGSVSGVLNGNGGDDDFSFAAEENIVEINATQNTGNLSSPQAEDSIQITNSPSLTVSDISFTASSSLIINDDGAALSGTTNIAIIQPDESDTIEAEPVTTITDSTFELTPTSTSDDEPTAIVEDTTSEDSSEAESLNEKGATNDESGGGSFNLFSLLIFGFLSLVHIRKTESRSFTNEHLLSTSKYHPSKTKFLLP